MYNAFISYSHAADGQMAPALQKGLENFAKPFLKSRSLDIFRDETSLSATPHLWKNIQDALDESEFLILMASPESSKSKWVVREIEYWLENKSIDTILIVLTDGEIIWNEKQNRIQDIENSSLPTILYKILDSEPFYIDLRILKTENDLSLKNPIFNKEVLRLSAQLHGKEPKDLASDEVNLQRKTKLRWIFVLSLITGLLIVSITFSIKAKNESDKAQGRYLMSRAQLEANPNTSFQYSKDAIKLFDDSIIKETAYNLYLEKGIYKSVPIQGKIQNFDSIAFFENDSIIYTGGIIKTNGSYNWRSGVEEIAQVWNINGDSIDTGLPPELQKKYGKPVFGNTNNQLFTVNYDRDVFNLYNNQDSIISRYPTVPVNGILLNSYVSSNNKTIVSVWSDHSVHLWDIKSGFHSGFQTSLTKNLQTYEESYASFYKDDEENYAYNYGATAISNNEKTLLVEAEEEFQLWDLSSKGFINSIILNDTLSEQIVDIFFSDDGQKINISKKEKTYQWNYNNDSFEALSYNVEVPSYSARKFNMDEENNEFPLIDNIILYKNEVENYKLDTLISLKEEVESYLVSPDRKWAITNPYDIFLSNSFSLRRTNLQDSSLPSSSYKKIFELPDGFQIISMSSFSEDSKKMVYILSSTLKNIEGLLKMTINLYDLHKHRIIKSYSFVYSEKHATNEFEITSLFSPNGRKLLVINGKLMTIIKLPEEFEEIFK